MNDQERKQRNVLSLRSPSEPGESDVTGEFFSTTKWKYPVLLLVGAIFLGIFLILGFGGLDFLLHIGISKILVLKEGTRIWDLWRTMPLPILIKFRFFNITNPVEFSTGAKAKLVELGPYTYLEDWEKVDLTVNNDDDTIRYRMTKTYFFQKHLSNGTEEDVLSLINIIFVATAFMAHSFTDEEFMLTQLDGMLADKGERLTITTTVRQILFDGVSVQPYLDLFGNPVLQDIAEEKGANLVIPENIADGKFGIFKGKNGTDDGYFVVKNGKQGSGEVAKIVSYKGMPVLKSWRGEPCNTIKGTDGTFYPPFPTKKSVINIFAPAMCRSFALEFHEESKTRGIQTYKFVGTLRNWMSSKSVPGNQCFCPMSKNETGTCGTDGLFNLQPCTGAPVLLSQPHFYGVTEDWVKNGVVGLKPEFEKHMTIMDFHPITGSPVEAKGRMQLSIELIPYEDMPTFSDCVHAVIPLAWFEEGSGIEGDPLNGLLLLDAFRNIFWYARFFFMGIGACMMGTGIFLVKRNRKPNTTTTKNTKNDSRAKTKGATNNRNNNNNPEQVIESEFIHPQVLQRHM